MRGSKFIIFCLALLIALIGISSIYSSAYQKAGLAQELYIRQLIWLLIGLAIYLLISNLNYLRLWDAAYFLYILAIFLLFLVFVLGPVRMGAQRWLKVVWLNFQPSEFAKLVMVIFFSRYFSKKRTDDISFALANAGVVSAIIVPFLLLTLPMGLVIEQPDLGTGTMLFSIFIAMLYVSGVRLKLILLFLILIILSTPIFWQFLHSYQKERLLVFLNPNIDPLGAGYTVIQSKIAIGSGGLFGKGWLAGTQSQLLFLPESHTDFIFATFAEQHGLIGSVVLFTLYYLIIRQGLSIANRSQENFGRLLAFGVSLMFSMQIFINIAMNLGLLPVVGLPLPLMSYGGSSMFMTFMALGILVSIDKR